MKTVVIDPGHGGTDPGATYKGYQEKSFNLDIARKVRTHLLNNYEVNVVMTRSSDVTMSLDARTNLANSRNADFFLSIHNNASGGSGFESYIYNGQVSNISQRAQNIIHAKVLNAVRNKYNIIDRGRKRANFHVLRETEMPAVLLEVLFVDNETDLIDLTNPAFIMDVAVAVAEGVKEALNLPPISQPEPEPEPDPDVLYKVIAGSFKDRENAEERVAYLKARNIDSFIVRTTISGTVYYRVQAGAYSTREAAEDQVNRLKNAGIPDAFIIQENTAPEPDPEVLYKVIAGSFRNRENAEERVAFLKARNIDSFIVQTTISGTVYYRVQAGAYSTKEAAEEQVEKLKNIGITGAFIITDGEVPEPDPEPEPEPEPEPLPSPINDMTILGDMRLNACQLDAFVKTINPNAPELGRFYIKYAAAYGIRGDIAYAQAIHETNYFRFTGVVKKEQNNYAGIGATGPDNPGATFKTPEEGVHAHIQHLYAYASKAPIPEGYSKVDPRFDLVTRGIATKWVQLNGKWAVPGTIYGQSIIAVFKRNANHALIELNKQQAVLETLLKEI